MSSLLPIYTTDNIIPAYQLNWSLTLFWKNPPLTDDWLEDLKLVTESDGIRILRHRFTQPDTSLFLLSTLPHIEPQGITRLVKGRLQYLIRSRWPAAFQRHFDLKSIGSTKCDKLEAYVASQVKHHDIPDERLRALFLDLQIQCPEVDLSQPRFSAHGCYCSNLHLVLVHDWRILETRAEVWMKVRDMIRGVSAKSGHLLSRAGIIPDHLHMTLGFRHDQAPIDVALSYMNNIAYVHDMKHVLMNGCYLGTFGEYDLGAVKDG